MCLVTGTHGSEGAGRQQCRPATRPPGLSFALSTPHRRHAGRHGNRAPARGESWIPPLGPAREGGALEAPEFDDALDDDDVPDNPENDASGRAPSGSQSNDEGATGASADVTEEPDADAADALCAVAGPDR